ncbi:MAG TPA: peptidylprolyl isomerase [Polyangiaceae bacterium LLY-WYZ-15_(1-7)]|nr:peptidylprolyl isomerase [Polyangiaceae bacterium LLY-WYZ-15_(1-7)]
MLDKLANRFQTYVLVALVTLLSAVFILQFGGPQAEGCTSGGSSYAAKVDGETISAGEFRSIYYLLGFNRAPADQQRRERLWDAVLGGLIERALLAQEARRLGYQVDEESVMRRLAEEGTIRVSLGIDSTYPGGELDVSGRLEDRDGNFDLERARNFIQHDLRRSVGEFTVAQMEEELAERMRQTVLAGVEVSESEVWDAYVRERDRARIEYVRFSPSYYREQLEATDEALAAWMDAHPEEVDREYEQNRHRYTDLEEQVRARHILIKASQDAAEEVRTAARQRAESLLRRARAGEDFEALASEFSEDTGSARRGGDLGYNPRGRMVPPFDEAQFGLEVGAISDLVETRFGFHIIKVVGKREGDVPEEEAKRELAERLFREDRAGELAREAATEALAQLQGGMSMEDLDDWLLRRERGEEEPVEGEEPAEGEAEEEAEPEEEPERNPLAPKVEETTRFGRTDNPIRGPFDSGPLVRDVFSRNLEDPIPEEPLQLGNDYVIYQLTERSEATREEYTDEVRQRLREGLLRAKRDEVLKAYVLDLRDRAQREGRIRIRAFELELTVEGNGEVTSDPSGIECGSDCLAAYEFGEMVQLTAETGTGAHFLGWDGACSGMDETCIVTMDQARTVSARFRGGSSSSSSDEEAPEESPSEDDAPADEAEAE